MVKVEKCCFCIRLSNFAIVLGSFGAFVSLSLILIVGVIILNYDSIAASLYEKGNYENGSIQLANFMRKWKNGEKLNTLESSLTY